jgi:hypothetical protein
MDNESINLLTETILGEATHSTSIFDFSAIMDIGNENHFASGFQEEFFGDFSIGLKEGGMGFHAENVALRAGVFPHFDIVNSPYSLFISGRGNSAPILDVSYADSIFVFSDRWIGLTVNSAYGWPDRGAVQKTYALVLGALRIGFQDIGVFTSIDRNSSGYFDLNYFLSPLPSYFVQYVASATGRPWSQAINDNSIMGFFADYKASIWYIYAQILIDDLNANRFLAPDSYQNPDKIAWSLGGSYDTPYGLFSLYHAGATAYTFESFGSGDADTMYGYSYYPADSFPSGPSLVAIDTEDNMVGYQHGENNIAFLASWKKEIVGIKAYAQAEFTLSGSKAAGNPWHEFPYWTDSGKSTRLLDDPVLEKKFIVSGLASYPWKDFTFTFDFSLGGVWNRLALRTVQSAAPANLQPFYAPSDQDAFLYALGLSCAWRP